MEDTERGAGRERWWKAAHQSTMIPTGGDAEMVEATDGFLRGVAAFWSEEMSAAVIIQLRAFPRPGALRAEVES